MDKTISFLILIGIGILSRSKINNKEQVNTIKILILTLALPAVILSSLLKINLSASLIYPPLFVLCFNLLMFLSVRSILPIFMGEQLNLSNKRTLMLMLPSLAPYLSCFPFLAELSEQSSLGLAAVADMGNKIFILVFLYFVTMYWFYGKAPSINQEKNNQRLLQVLLQPINLAIIFALIASTFGISLESLPAYFQDSLSYLRNILTPIVLIFIGLAVKVKSKELKLLLGLLIWRGSVAFLLSALLISIFSFSSVATILLIVAFPQSSCSFLPYAQMSVFSELQDSPNKTFNQSLALSLLAISLPFSSFTVVTIYSLKEFFVSPVHLLGLGVTGLLVSSVLLKERIRVKVTKKVSSSRQQEVKAATNTVVELNK